MSAPASTGGQLVTDKKQLVENLEDGLTPRQEWRIGTEHEKLVFRRDDLKPATYDGERGIKAALTAMTRFGWNPVYEAGNIIGLKKDDGSNISLEPGGQFELSGAPLTSLHQTCSEVGQHLHQVREICDELNLGMIGMGFAPHWRVDDIDWMPKQRYRIMRQHMRQSGSLGEYMMALTCTVQVNLDYDSEADMVKKFRVGLALQPIATALFASSPFKEGKPCGMVSFRDYIWHDPDKGRDGANKNPDYRIGSLPFVFEDGMGFERYADYAIDSPMFFVFRDGKYLDAKGCSFRTFMEGKLDALPGELPNMADWENHLTTLFPQVRIKKFMEMRGADAGPWSRICALPAFWVGLLYQQETLDAAWDLVKDWTPEEYEYLQSKVYIKGLKTPFRDGLVRDVAQAALAISARGLDLRRETNGWGQNEQVFLDPLIESAATGRALADVFVDRFHHEWKQDVSHVFREFAY